MEKDFPSIEQTAAQYQLGLFQTVYEPGKEVWLYRLPGFFALLVGGAILYYFFHAYDAIFSGWPGWQMVFVPLIGSGWIGVGLWVLLAPWISPEQRVFVFQEGLIYRTRKLEVIRWDQMERFWKDIHFDKKMRKISSYIIRRSDRAFFVFAHDLINIEKLGMVLEEELTRRLLPRAITAYNAGDPVLFDDIALSVRWIRVRQGSKKLLWSEFDHIHINETTVEIYKKGPIEAWATLKVSEIPNIGVLKGLIAYAQYEIALDQLPQIIAYKAGLPVIFGPLTLSQRGVEINNGRHILPWNEIAAIGVGESEVIIRRKDNPKSWYVLPCWMIPDTPGLKELVNYVMQISFP